MNPGEPHELRNCVAMQCCGSQAHVFGVVPVHHPDADIGIRADGKAAFDQVIESEAELALADAEYYRESG